MRRGKSVLSLISTELYWRRLRSSGVSLVILLERDEITTKNVARWVAQSARNLSEWRATARYSQTSTISPEFTNLWSQSGRNTIAHGSLPLFVEGIDRMHRHLERGHRVVLVTGTLAPLARAIARHLPRGVEVRATKLEIQRRLLYRKTFRRALGVRGEGASDRMNMRRSSISICAKALRTGMKCRTQECLKPWGILRP